jgi:RimJ/RimL family protein N-acetyltransferase
LYKNPINSFMSTLSRTGGEENPIHFFVSCVAQFPIENEPAMASTPKIILETKRLLIRTAAVEDASLYCALWTDPRVMNYVGFPQGLRIERAEIEARLARQGEGELSRLLVLALKDTSQPIGECWIAQPDEQGIVELDVKLLPQFWGHQYGREAWQALVDYAFTHTTCSFVQGTPNVENIASIKMQEAAGGVRIGEGICEFPEEMKPYTTPVHYATYQVSRADWQRRHPDARGLPPILSCLCLLALLLSACSSYALASQPTEPAAPPPPQSRRSKRFSPCPIRLAIRAD